MTWYVTVTEKLAESFLLEWLSHAGSVAEGAANRKELKYQSLTTIHTFIVLAFETLDPINSNGVAFFKQLGGRLTACTGDMRETSCFSAYHLQFSASMPFVSKAAFIPISKILTRSFSQHLFLKF
jgi:hypothetical protein